MILALESSGKTASVAVIKNEKVVCESSQSIGFFHSQTLMVLLKNMVDTARIRLSDLKLIAVSSGPGSFTGLRIGVAAARGVATGLGIDCTGVSTLRGLAMNFYGLSVFVCALIDARNGFFYCGLFDIEHNAQIGQDEVVSLADLILKLQNLKATRGKPVVLVGDGAENCYSELKIKGLSEDSLKLARGQTNLARAASVGLCAYIDQQANNLNLKFKLNYLRPSQAQRMLNERSRKKMEGSDGL